MEATPEAMKMRRRRPTKAPKQPAKIPTKADLDDKHNNKMRAQLSEE